MNEADGKAYNLKWSQKLYLILVILGVMHTLINCIIPSGIVVLLKRLRYSMMSLVWKR